MMSSENYLLGWLVYLCGAVGLLVCWWHVTRRVPQLQWRLFLRLLVAVLLLTPYNAGPELSEWAPALVMTLLEGIFHGPEAMLRAGVPVLVALLCAVLIAALGQLGWQRWQQYRHRQQQQQDRQQALEAERRALLNESAAAE